MARNFCLLILFVLGLDAKENFWFSYKIVTQNSIMIHEERNISPVMSYDKDEKAEFFCKFSAKKDANISTYEFLQRHYESLLPCFYKANSRIQSYAKSELKAQKNQNEVTILPVKFTVEFKDEFANIYLLKEK